MAVLVPTSTPVGVEGSIHDYPPPWVVPLVLRHDILATIYWRASTADGFPVNVPAYTSVVVGGCNGNVTDDTLVGSQLVKMSIVYRPVKDKLTLSPAVPAKAFHTVNR